MSLLNGHVDAITPEPVSSPQLTLNGRQSEDPPFPTDHLDPDVIKPLPSPRLLKKLQKSPENPSTLQRRFLAPPSLSPKYSRSQSTDSRQSPIVPGRVGTVPTRLNTQKSFPFVANSKPIPWVVRRFGGIKKICRESQTEFEPTADKAGTSGTVDSSTETMEDEGDKSYMNKLLDLIAYQQQELKHLKDQIATNEENKHIPEQPAVSSVVDEHKRDRHGSKHRSRHSSCRSDHSHKSGTSHHSHGSSSCQQPSLQLNLLRFVLKQVNEECRKTSQLLGISPKTVSVVAFEEDWLSGSDFESPSRHKIVTDKITCPTCLHNNPHTQQQLVKTLTTSLANLKACNEELRHQVLELYDLLTSQRVGSMPRRTRITTSRHKSIPNLTREESPLRHDSIDISSINSPLTTVLNTPTGSPTSRRRRSAGSIPEPDAPTSSKPTNEPGDVAQPEGDFTDKSRASNEESIQNPPLDGVTSPKSRDESKHRYIQMLREKLLKFQSTPLSDTALSVTSEKTIKTLSDGRLTHMRLQMMTSSRASLVSDGASIPEERHRTPGRPFIPRSIKSRNVSHSNSIPNQLNNHDQ